MKFDRLSGILLHPTSLPGPYGIGDLGRQAYKWLDFLAASGCGIWQVLPLGPTGYGDSPYQCFSTFAGNPYLVSFELLLEEGLLSKEDLEDMPSFDSRKVDYGALISWKVELLNKAFERFQKGSLYEEEYQQFRFEQHLWLEDFAFFMALKEKYGGGPWVNWPEPLRKRSVKETNEARRQNDEDIRKQIFRQFIFFRQWRRLRDYAHEKNIQIVGDLPIYVAHDSSDVWVNPDLYYLKDNGQPTVVAGVPPDYFSETGQLWGNPIYRWDVHAADGFRWWVARIRQTLNMVDVIRIDHFRGFVGYWEVPSEYDTAVNGRWVKGPGANFFEAVREQLGELPLIAEDLGVITPEVVALREQFNLPGMKIFQFGFASGLDDPFLPHMYPINCIAYTGTHDNDTVVGWFEKAEEGEKVLCQEYLDTDGEDIAWDMIDALWRSRARTVVAPMQDFLSIGSEARMNYPSKLGGNWQWRLKSDEMTDFLAEKIAVLNRETQRFTSE
jgi:4-alpha-glucanotransferase